MPGEKTTLIGIDTGGTFSDFVFIRSGKIHVLKVLSTPEDPGLSIISGLKKIVETEDFDYSVIHGSTVATNALLERKGSRSALVTTKGFEDLLEIGRQNRNEIYNIFVSRPQPLIPSSLRFGIAERTLHDGQILKSIDKHECTRLLNRLLKRKIFSLAVCFLHSYVNPKNEAMFARIARKKGFHVSLSSEILPEYREYERMSTTTVNAYVAPIMDTYLKSLQENLQGKSLRIMKSNGGIITAKSAGTESANTILSGPAGGVVGAFAVGKQAGYEKLITFDMGGTSTDVALCPGRIPMSSESVVAGCPIKVPMIDIHTVGAGGGSVASMDIGGALKVGPESAGADPGPVSYGKGNKLTVTDANLYLNRLDAAHFLGGEMFIDRDRLEPVIDRKAQEYGMRSVDLAEGIIKVVNSNMEKALRVISIEKGYNPADFALVSFGGAGSLHAADLARSLTIKTIIIPNNPGIYSAVGMLHSDFVKDYSKTILVPVSGKKSGVPSRSASKIDKAFLSLEKSAVREMLAEGVPRDKIRIQKSIDVRYKGQSFELTVPYTQSFLTAFHKMHERFYGFSDRTRETEAVTVRIKCIGKTSHPRIGTTRKSGPKSAHKALIGKRMVYCENTFRNADIYSRNKLTTGNEFKGPAVIHEYSATTYVPPGFSVKIDKFENMILKYSK